MPILTLTLMLRSRYWEDREHGFKDWRECPVTGEHIARRKTKGSAALAKAKGADGEVFRAMWKTSIPVAIKKNIKGMWGDELTEEMRLFLGEYPPVVVVSRSY
jgi:hypothetical protein|eukprot:SAG25_NODE_2000_length_2041_cov_1.412976_2_plen_103_part_00